VGNSVVITGIGLDAVQQIRFAGAEPASFTRTGPDTISGDHSAECGERTDCDDRQRIQPGIAVSIEITTPTVSSVSGGLTLETVWPGASFPPLTGTNLDRVHRLSWMV